VRALPEEDRKLVLLCGLEGLPHKEVAARMELGVEAVTKRWQRLRAKLEAARLPEHLLVLDGAAP
jgi:DNA-directed RNA polymerase specialized sigma24 family protein